MVGVDDVVGEYLFRLPNIGFVALFMQSKYGILFGVVVPILVLVVWDVIKRWRYEKRRELEMQRLLEEKEVLRMSKDV